MSTARFAHLQQRVVTTLELMAAARMAYAESKNRVFLYTHAQLRQQNAVWLRLIHNRITDGELGGH